MVHQARSFIFVLGFVCSLSVSVADAATLPEGFSEALVAQGLASPTAMQFAPDGRLFILEQTGAVRIVKDGQLLPTPFVTLTVNAEVERGLLGIAFDPAFTENGYVYLYYTATDPTVHNRLSRFTANGDVAVPGSEVPLMDLDLANSSGIHNGGALDFGPDGKLYIAVGDNASFENSQRNYTPFGKILRINPDGSIPTDNPFFNTPGAERRIWVWGLRNPFTFAFNSSDSRLFVNDVGFGTWEEINDAHPGDNFGWSPTEGPFDPAAFPDFENPFFAYDHPVLDGAITGGAFYTPPTAQFPSDYTGDYFFADYAQGWIRRLDSAASPGSALPPIWASGIAAPVGLRVSTDGSLYYLARGAGATTGVVYRITYTTPGAAPQITSHPANVSVAAGQPATFTVTATGAAPLAYRWQRNGIEIPGQTGNGSPSYTVPSATLQDSGATFRVLVTNAVDDVLSNSATLTVINPNDVPVATITQPVVNATYSGGTVINYAGTGTDPQDGALPASAFTWQIDFHHDTHTHPFLQPTAGAMSGSVTIPRVGETSANVWYRIYLTVRDSGGLTHTVFRDVLPNKVRLTLNTEPAGLPVSLDGPSRATPFSVDSVVGIMRNLSAPSPLVAGNTTYEFVSWSDGGYATHDISTPGADITYTATYRPVSATAPPPAPILETYTNGLTVQLSWAPVTGATSYVLEAGSTPNAADLLNANIGELTMLQGVIPAGTYFARIRSVGPGGTSAPSNEATIQVAGSGLCTTPPPVPSGYMAEVSDLTVLLSWDPSPSATSYVLEAGTSSGLADVLTANVGNLVSLGAAGPAGTYFTRLRAFNACGPSAPSAELPVTLGCSGTPPVSGLTFTKINGIVTLTWTPSPGAAFYQLQVGTAPGLADVLNGPVGNTTSLSANVAGLPPITFYVRVVAANSCGASAASNEVAVPVP